MEKQKVRTVILNVLVNELSKQDGVKVARLVHDASAEDDAHESEYAIELIPFDDSDKGPFRLKENVVTDIVRDYFGSALKKMQIKKITNSRRVDFNVIWKDTYHQLSIVDVYISNLMEAMEKVRYVNSINRIDVIDTDKATSVVEEYVAMSSIVYEHSAETHISEYGARYIVSADISISIEYALKDEINTSYVDILHDIRRLALECSIGNGAYDENFRIKHLGLIDDGRYIEMSIEITI